MRHCSACGVLAKRYGDLRGMSASESPTKTLIMIPRSSYDNIETSDVAPVDKGCSTVRGFKVEEAALPTEAEISEELKSVYYFMLGY